jgi:hypothetical protein
MILHCIQCSGEGRIFKSKYGGNDPDVWDAGKCEACDGSGNAACENRGCENNAVGFDQDGNGPFCEDCLMEAAMGEFGP